MGTGMTRRDFVKGCAAGVAVAMLPGGAHGTPGAAPGEAAPAGPPAVPPGSGRTAEALALFGGLGVDLPLMERVLAAGLTGGGESSELFFEHAVVRQVMLEDGVVNRASSLVTLGVGVRVLAGEQTGYAFTEELTPESMLAAAELAAAIARAPAGARRVGLAPRETTDLYPVQRAWPEVGVEDKIPLLLQMQERAASFDPRIRKVSLSFVDEERRILVATSDGVLRGDRRPLTRCIVSCSAQQGSRREENSFNLSARAGFEYYTPERVAHLGTEAARRTVALFEAIVPPAGELPLVLAAGSSGILLHEAIGHGMEADFNRKGISIYADRIGKPIARPLVTIVDDGTLPGMRGAINFDDEGNDTQRTVLVADGVLRTFLHDRISAAAYQVSPTGNGRRESFRHPPFPRMRCTYMQPGPHAREEIIRSVKRGIYAQTFTNGQVQIGAGDFTFFIKQGFLIEDGKLTRPIKDVNLIGNGPRVLEEVSMVGDDLLHDEGGWTCGKEGQGVPVSLGMPTVRVDRITVGGVNA